MKRIKNDHFRFKQFTVSHKRSSMKVGTDGVLLGAWANVSGCKTILDIGTGTGVIALMIAQRTSSDTLIDAVELTPNAAQDAQENFVASPWNNRIKLYQTSIQHYQTETRYDLIISNPPYFSKSYKPPDEDRLLARHTENLSFTELLNTADGLLLHDGRLSVILPVTEGRQFIDLAARQKFYCTREWHFLTRRNKPVERLLLEFSRNQILHETGEILLYEHGEEWSAGYKQLLREFYLKIS
ncbi:MAG: methyltransferase [Cyclobacteriaceae bacterium]|nr:methyltransferase [Cyclobacteriaceae bacterium]